MATILRTEKKDYGGVEVWVQEDVINPIYLYDGIVTDARLNKILVLRAAQTLLAKKLAVFEEVRANIEGQIAKQLDRIEAYIATHPAVTATQIRTAVLNRVQSIFMGDVV